MPHVTVDTPHRLRVFDSKVLHYLPPEHWYPTTHRGVTSRVVELGGQGAVRIVESGPKAGPPAVLIHGWAGSAYSFRHLLPLLAEAGMRGIALDLRGHGGSAKPVEALVYRPDSLVKQISSLLKVLDLTRAVLVGESMGGAVAFDVLLAGERRAGGAVLVAPVGVTAIRRVALARALRATRWLPSRVPRWCVRLVLYRVYGHLRSYSEEDVEQYWAPAQDPAYAPALYRYIDEFDWSRRPKEQFAGLAGRIRVVLGERDRLVTTSRAREWLDVLPPAHVAVVRRAGHLVAEEAPEAVMAAILDMATEARNQ